MTKGKQARICCFCENTANSKEHYYSKWLKREIMKSANKCPDIVTQHLVWDFDGELRRGAHFNRGHPVSRSVRSVCVSCNIGWMSRLQDSAKPVLLPLALGSWRALSVPEANLVASWATMFTMSVDQVEFPLARLPIDQRYWFKSKREPLVGWSIRIGILDDPTMQVWFDHATLSREGLDGDHWGHIAFARLGRLVLYTSSSAGSEDFVSSTFSVIPKYLDKLGMIQLWPKFSPPLSKPVNIHEEAIRQLVDDLAKTRQAGCLPDFYRQQTLYNKQA